MVTKNKNVFISHYGKDDDQVQELKKLVESKGYTFRNSSIDSTKPNDASNDHYIKYSLLRPGIQWAGTVIVLIGERTHTREWVNWEIEQAQKLGTRVVGVYKAGLNQDPPQLPDAFNRYGDALVGWQGERVIDAIEGRINNFKKLDGSDFESMWVPKSINC